MRTRSFTSAVAGDHSFAVAGPSHSIDISGPVQPIYDKASLEMQLSALYQSYCYTRAKRRLLADFERQMKLAFLESANKVQAAGGIVPSLD